jgi:hypothetical protein
MRLPLFFLAVFQIVLERIHPRRGYIRVSAQVKLAIKQVPHLN